jgi:hypothetical protein
VEDLVTTVRVRCDMTECEVSNTPVGAGQVNLYRTGELGESVNGLNAELDGMYGDATAMLTLVQKTFGGTDCELETCWKRWA